MKTILYTSIFLVVVVVGGVVGGGGSSLHARSRLSLSLSPVHFHQTGSSDVSGWIGVGLGLEIDSTWAVNLSWDYNQSIFLTMEVALLDTNRTANVYTVEVMRSLHK